jgi:hypothetical protein
VAVETGDALPLSAARRAPYGLTSEAGEAFSRPSQHVAPPGIAGELATVFALLAAKVAPPGIAVETDESPGAGASAVIVETVESGVLGEFVYRASDVLGETVARAAVV